MIGKLRGIVDSTEEDSVLLDVNGVGYQLFCSLRTLAGLEEGAAAALIVETHVREDHFHLYGFPDSVERDWFRLLTTVQGVGVKMALAILSAYTPEQITLTIASGDTAMLTRISGVGPKLAARLVTELKNKVSKLPSATVVPFAPAGKKGAKGKPAAAAGATEEAVSALVNLGYSRAEAFTAIAAVQRHQGGAMALDTLIRDSLRELAR